MLQYFPADNNDAGRRWLLKPFNEVGSKDL
jgi:hypothetical protein